MITWLESFTMTAEIMEGCQSGLMCTLGKRVCFAAPQVQILFLPPIKQKEKSCWLFFFCMHICAYMCIYNFVFLYAHLHKWTFFDTNSKSLKFVYVHMFICFVYFWYPQKAKSKVVSFDYSTSNPCTWISWWLSNKVIWVFVNNNCFANYLV